MAEPLEASRGTEAPTLKAADWWDRFEKAARVLSLIAIPIVLAIVGWLIQSSLSKRNVSQEYVKLAVSILKEPEDKTAPELRGWAVDLLNENSPTKFSPQVLEALKGGAPLLQSPALISLVGPRSGASLDIGPDGKIFATGHSDGTARLLDAASGKSKMILRDHSAAVTSIAFSPDAHSLLTGSLDDGKVILWDLTTGRKLHRWIHTDGVIGVAFAPDGASIFTRSSDGDITSWSVADGRQLSTLKVPE